MTEKKHVFDDYTSQSALWEAFIFSENGDGSKGPHWSDVNLRSVHVLWSLMLPQRFEPTSFLMKMENAFLKHYSEDILWLDLKNDSCKSSLVSASLCFSKPFL